MTSLSELTTLRLGGPAARTVTAATAEEIVDSVAEADASGEPVLLIGGGSNLVVPDQGWPGVVVLLRSQGIDRVGDEVTVQAGVVWDELVETSVRNDWSGLAPMSGIPGRTGATPVQNVDAYGTGVSDTISRARVYDRETKEVAEWSPARCEFGFRTSAFKYTDRYVVLAVTFTLPSSPDAPPVRYLELAKRLGVEVGERAPSTLVRETVLGLRRGKGMVLDAEDHDTWSVGSFFINPFVPPDRVPAGCPNWPSGELVKLSAAWLIENAGFGKGYGNGRVSVSHKHSLALTNRGDGTTAELMALAAEIADGVDAKYGIRLLPEPRIV